MFDAPVHDTTVSVVQDDGNDNILVTSLWGPPLGPFGPLWEPPLGPFGNHRWAPLGLGFFCSWPIMAHSKGSPFRGICLTSTVSFVPLTLE